MSVFTTLRFLDPYGVPLTEVATYGTPGGEGQATVPLSYVLNCAPGGIGVLETTLPLSFNTQYLLPDTRIGVWRSINGRSPYLDNSAIYLIRYLDYGPTGVFVRAYHATSLLDRRIIAYAAGSSFTRKSATFADNLIKTFVSEQMGAGIVGASRDGVETFADVSAYLTLQGNLSNGASIAKTATRRRLLDVCTELAQASNTAGTYLTFEIAAPTESTLELRTYTGQRGVDRRASTTNPVVFSQARGNLINAHLVTDYTQMSSFVVAGGQGEEANRTIGTSIDTALAGASPFGRIERFRDAANVSTQAAVDDEADDQLRGARPMIVFTGQLVETPALMRGIDFDLGDLATAETTTGQQYDIRIDVIKETIESSGRRVECGLRSMT